MAPIQKVFAGLVLLCFSTSMFASELYRYRGANDEIVIDDRIPTEFVHKGYEVLNSSGFVVERIEPALSEEDLAKLGAEKRLEEEKKRQEERDKWLLNRFSDASDAVRARDRQLGALETLVVFGKSKIKKLKEEEKKELSYAAAEERQGKEVSKQILERIEAIRTSIRSTEQQIENKKAEQEKIKTKYQEFIDRLKEIEARRNMSADNSGESEGWGN